MDTDEHVTRGEHKFTFLVSPSVSLRSFGLLTLFSGVALGTRPTGGLLTHLLS